MKKLVVCICSTFLFFSCASAMKFTKHIEPVDIKNMSSPNMEFIGFKGTSNSLGSDYTSWSSFKELEQMRQFGEQIQKGGIALDRMFAYFGVYELTEIASYKNKLRYLTFVEVEKHRYTAYTNSMGKTLWLSLGSSFATSGLLFTALGDEFTGVGIAFSLGGLLAMIPGFIPEKTTIYFEGIYNIYVYDTTTKEIIYKDTVPVGPYSDKYSGSYIHPNTDQKTVDGFYANLITRALYNKYLDIAKFIEARE